MALEVGIVGLPNVGKSTIFNALTAAGALAANYPFATIEPNVGVVAVPDARLNGSISSSRPRKIIPARLRVVDIAGIVRGAIDRRRAGQQVPQSTSARSMRSCTWCAASRTRTSRTSETASIPSATSKPSTPSWRWRTWRRFRVARQEPNGSPAAATRRRSPVPRSSSAAATAQHGPAGARAGFRRGRAQDLTVGLITAKQVLYVANVDESDIHGEGPLVQKVREKAKGEGGHVVPSAASSKRSLSELARSDRQEMLESMGLKEPALATLQREAYKLLGLHSYFTAGPKEIRAWTIPSAPPAPRPRASSTPTSKRIHPRRDLHAR
jgi:hypothetical protein